MALKDHKRELYCATAIAGLIRHQAIQKNNAMLQVGMAIKALAKQKENDEFELEQIDIKLATGTTWGAW